MQRLWFTVGLFLAPLLAWLYPPLGQTNGILHTEILNKIGIIIIFFVSGLLIKTEFFFQTTRKAKAHIYVQGFCFLIFPLLMMSLSYCLFDYIPIAKPLKTGLLILACLPTTITSCVVLTRLSEGDESIALFNGILSNLIAVFLSPLLISIFLDFSPIGSISLDRTSMIIYLATTVLFPVALGQATRTFFRKGLKKYDGYLRTTSNLIVVFIMYTVFCDLFIMDLDKVSNFSQIAILIILLVFIHILFLLLSNIGCYSLRFSQKETRAIIFTAPQKTLAMGIPLVSILVKLTGGAETNATLYAIPLIFYHHIQLLIAGILIPWVLKKK